MKPLRDSCYGLFCGGLLAMIIILAVIGSLGCATTEKETACEWEAGEPQKWQPDYERAQKELIPWTVNEDGSAIYAWVHQWTCCDCGLVHRMLFVPVKEGLAIYLWRLEPETRKRRMQKGMIEFMSPLRIYTEDQGYDGHE